MVETAQSQSSEKTIISNRREELKKEIALLHPHDNFYFRGVREKVRLDEESEKGVSAEEGFAVFARDPWYALQGYATPIGIGIDHQTKQVLREYVHSDTSRAENAYLTVYEDTEGIVSNSTFGSDWEVYGNRGYGIYASADHVKNDTYRSQLKRRGRKNAVVTQLSPSTLRAVLRPTSQLRSIIDMLHVDSSDNDFELATNLALYLMEAQQIGEAELRNISPQQLAIEMVYGIRDEAEYKRQNSMPVPSPQISSQ